MMLGMQVLPISRLKQKRSACEQETGCRKRIASSLNEQLIVRQCAA